MNKAIIATLVSGAVIAGALAYSKSQEDKTHSIVTLQGVNSSGVNQTLTFDNSSCLYTDSLGTNITGKATFADVEESCKLGFESTLNETQFICALELCKNTP